MEHITIDGIPILVASPNAAGPPGRLALWMPALGLEKEAEGPFLEELAESGFVAVALDLWQHGERGSESAEELRNRVFSDYRRYKWPIIGQTAIDALRVIDWALATFGLVNPAIVAGGISLGGDVAVVLAGIDSRVSRVAGIGASPDWTSPGMHSFADPSVSLDQGVADAYAQWFYDQLDPLTHLDRYVRSLGIAFEFGANDQHVPPVGALRFRALLDERSPGAAERIRITVHPGVGHIDGVKSPELHRRCLEFLLALA